MNDKTDHINKRKGTSNDQSRIDRAINLLREGMEATGTSTLHYQKMRGAVELLQGVDAEGHNAEEERNDRISSFCD